MRTSSRVRSIESAAAVVFDSVVLARVLFARVLFAPVVLARVVLDSVVSAAVLILAVVATTSHSALAGGPPAPGSAAANWPELVAPNPIPRSEAVFVDLPGEPDGLRPSNLDRWLMPVPDTPSRLLESDRGGRKFAGFSGTFKLRITWGEDTVLRFAPFDHDQLAIYFWSGETGVAFAFHQHPRPAWAAYTVTREPGQFVPKTHALSGTDGDRLIRSGLGRLEIRHQAGRLVLSRGDIPILSAAMPSLPRDVYLHRGAWFRTFNLYRGDALVDERPAVGPVLFDTAAREGTPERVAWQPRLSLGSNIESGPDGAVTLSAEKTTEPAMAVIPWPRRTPPVECVFEVERATPGTGIVILNREDKPLAKVQFVNVQFVRETRNSGVMAALVKGDEDRGGQSLDIVQQVLPLLGSRTWMKLTFSSGHVKLWFSDNGEHWGRAAAPLIDADLTGLASLALVCDQTNTHSAITVRRMVIREFPAFSRLCPPSIRERISTALTEQYRDLGNWNSLVLDSQPADVSPADWRRACAVATLGTPPHSFFGNRVLLALLDDAIAAEAGTAPPLAGGVTSLELFRDVVAAYDGWHEYQSSYLHPRLLRIGEMLAARGDPDSWTTIGRLSVGSDWWVNVSEQRFAPPNLGRRSLLQAVVADDWSAAWRTSRRIRFWLQAAHPDWHWPWDLRELRPEVDWTESLSARRIPPQQRGPTPLPPLPAAWRHPVRLEADKTALNAVAEFENAIADSAIDDVCRQLAAMPPGAFTGLIVPGDVNVDPQTARGMVTLSRYLLSRPAADRPWLAEMKRNYTAIADLRYRTAAARNDSAAMYAVATQFAGCESAGRAWVWLADRALSAGEFTAALAACEHGAAFIGDEQANGEQADGEQAKGEQANGEQASGEQVKDEQAIELRARAALAGALAWRTAAGAGTGSQPPTSAVVEQWSAAVAASRNTAVQAAWQRIQSQPTGATGGSGAAIDHTVMPRAFTSEVRGRWEGDVGTDAGHPPSGEVDWFARQFAAALVGEIAYLTNRYQIAAFDLARGQVLWNRGMGAEQGKTHRWPLAKCQPLVQGGRVYVRQMGQERPILLALKSDTGAVDWQTGPDLNVISDPFHVDSGLYAITAGDRIDAYWTLWLTRFDPHTGEIIAQRSLLSAADHWDGQLTGWVTPAAGGLVAVVAGSVFLSDLEGRIQWIRRQPLHPNHPDWKTHEQSGGPPLVASGRVVAFQPGACAVEAFDAATGSLVGSAPLVDVRRIVGIADQAVVVETPQQLVALDLADELRVKWSVGLQRLFDATVQADGSVLAVRRQSSLHDKWRVQLAWIDSKTGSPIDTAAIDSLNDNESWLGPLVPWRGGIVSFYGRNLSQPQRDVVMLSPIESGSTEERRPHPGDLSDTEDLWTHDLVERKVLRAIRDRLPGWTCLFAGSDARTGLTDHAGESGVVCTQSLPYRSVRLVSSVTVPLGRPRLVIRAGGEAGRTWTCRVRVRDRIVHEFVVGDDPGFNGWASWEVDLREFAGQTVSLVVEQAVDREPALGFWKQLEVVTSG